MVHVMADLQKKFSEAAKMISFGEASIQKCVYGAFVDHLSDINSTDLPEEIQIFYESIKIRLTSVFPPGDIGNNEATHVGRDILYMAKFLSEYPNSARGC